MDRLKIKEPCQENWSGMVPTETGAFCQQCAAQVMDFTAKSNAEIKAAFREMAGKPVCTRIKASQLETLNREVEAWQLNSSRRIQSALIFSLVVVFGLSLFSCSTEKEKQTVLKIQETVTQAWILPVSTAIISSQNVVAPAVAPEAVKAVGNKSGIGCAEPLSTTGNDYIIMGLPVNLPPRDFLADSTDINR